MLHEAAYGEGSPLGSSTFAVNLNKLSAEDVMSYRAHTYNGNNVTGNRYISNSTYRHMLL
jgi:hypothetical protein